MFGTWLIEYTKRTTPADAKSNNNQSGIREIETAYKILIKSLAAAPDDKKRVHKWMDEFRRV